MLSIDDIIQLIIDSDALQDLTLESEELAQASHKLELNPTKYRKRRFKFMLASLNAEITSATDLISEADLEIARELINSERIEQQYQRDTEG